MSTPIDTPIRLRLWPTPHTPIRLRSDSDPRPVEHISPGPGPPIRRSRIGDRTNYEFSSDGPPLGGPEDRSPTISRTQK